MPNDTRSLAAIAVGDRLVGPGHPCFVIAEAGVNHDGDPQRARELIDAARDAGADAVKFQTWVTEDLVAPSAPLAEYQAANTQGDGGQYDMLKRLELSQESFRDLKSYADAHGMRFMSTPDDVKSCDFLCDLGVPALKIGSAEVTNLGYLRHVGRKRLPIILSTGMATLDEVGAAVRTIVAEGNPGLILLHCVSAYPSDPADSNLRAMDTLAETFQCPVGFSDHTMTLDVSLAAVARGACVIERHLTLDRHLPGPDHKASLLPEELTALVRGIRNVEAALGDGVKRPTAGELGTRAVVRRSLVASRNLPAGTQLVESDVVLLRAGAGLGPEHMDSVVGRTTRHAIRQGTPLTWDSLE